MVSESPVPESLSQWLARRKHGWLAHTTCFIGVGQLIAESQAAGLATPLLDPSRVLLVDERPTKIAGQMPRPAAEPAESEALKEATLDDSSLRSDPMLGAVNLDELEPHQQLYIAPERLVGLPNNERSEQFSFCAMLYVALYGIPPLDYNKRTSNDLPVFTPVRFPRGGPAPRALVQVLERGLSIQPSQRWPSMDVLVEQLRTASGVGRRQRVLALSASLALAAAALTALWWTLR